MRRGTTLSKAKLSENDADENGNKLSRTPSRTGNQGAGGSTRLPNGDIKPTVRTTVILIAIACALWASSGLWRRSHSDVAGPGVDAGLSIHIQNDVNLGNIGYSVLCNVIEVRGVEAMAFCDDLLGGIPLVYSFGFTSYLGFEVHLAKELGAQCFLFDEDVDDETVYQYIAEPSVGEFLDRDHFHFAPVPVQLDNPMFLENLMKDFEHVEVDLVKVRCKSEDCGVETLQWLSYFQPSQILFTSNLEVQIDFIAARLLQLGYHKVWQEEYDYALLLVKRKPG
uniref:Uncharacterized protein n=2 Tax=Rhodosorus marinus TaxID=101924 RepID=A0A7S3EMV5_9RHOD|mmetsp:Transcript_4595/g.19712  ORF Transcript_4595/g.19712 Transcript_4595/m.19712 type:complete len:281 (+) Transcript_4595:140-982(+)